MINPGCCPDTASSQVVKIQMKVDSVSFASNAQTNNTDYL